MCMGLLGMECAGTLCFTQSLLPQGVLSQGMVYLDRRGEVRVACHLLHMVPEFVI